ncbi:hypothetical protein [Streptomyces sp. SM1]|uniref:hypothetical protein n=1 Tax=Streptomyces sp. SM1 TaxID=402229 RepID=UPI0011B071E0|nr:hypothetical protein [Streptomyces sp. SM1]
MSRGRIEVTRAAWRHLRGLLVSGGGQDRTGSSDEPEKEEETRGTPGRAGGPGPAQPAPDTSGSEERIVGCFAVLGVLFISSVSIVMLTAAHGFWDASWRTVAWIVVSVVIAVIAAALAWRAGKARQCRRKDPSGANPPAERTEDDQNSVGKP